jgi:hypothetical protein
MIIIYAQMILVILPLVAALCPVYVAQLKNVILPNVHQIMEVVYLYLLIPIPHLVFSVMLAVSLLLVNQNLATTLQENVLLLQLARMKILVSFLPAKKKMEVQSVAILK